MGELGSRRSRESGWIAKGRQRRRGSTEKRNCVARQPPGETKGRGRAWDLSSWTGLQIWPSHAVSNPTRSWVDGWASCRTGQVDKRIEAGFFFSVIGLSRLGTTHRLMSMQTNTATGKTTRLKEEEDDDSSRTYAAAR